MWLTRKARWLAVAALVGLIAIPVAVHAYSLTVTVYLTDASDSGGPKLQIDAVTGHVFQNTYFTEAYPFIDGRPIQDNEDDPWHSLGCLVQCDSLNISGETGYWRSTYSVSSGWHYVDVLGHTADNQWVWEPATQWINVAP
jgi:hypothetical protein